MTGRGCNPDDKQGGVRTLPHAAAAEPLSLTSSAAGVALDETYHDGADNAIAASIGASQPSFGQRPGLTKKPFLSDPSSAPAAPPAVARRRPFWRPAEAVHRRAPWHVTCAWHPAKACSA